MKTTLKIRTTAIKALSLLLVLNLAFACSNNKDNSTTNKDVTTQNATTNAKSVESITVNGTVKAISFGKDGYTAEIKTDTAGNYAALVSIVNVGGPGKYQQSAIGDKVSFKGVPSVVGGVKHLQVTEIIGVTSLENQVLALKYNKIKPKDYCWQSTKELKLHTQPNSDSKVEGSHFAGETLTVLGTKIVNNQLWVNVKYNLTVKAGYEGQFADGRVTPNGLPTGWIGGAEVPKINCK